MTPWWVDPELRGIERHVYFEDETEPAENIYRRLPAIIHVGPVLDSGSRRDMLARRIAGALNDAGVVA